MYPTRPQNKQVTASSVSLGISRIQREEQEEEEEEEEEKHGFQASNKETAT
jgi:hypothetical protein